MKKCDKRNGHISSKHHMINVYSNNLRHPVTKTFTNILIQFLSSAYFEHLMFIFKETIFFLNLLLMQIYNLLHRQQ